MPKNKNIEEIYQKKTPIEHILIRPDTYIGSTSLDLQQMWVWDEETHRIIRKNISFCPGLYKIFDEILVNAADNKQRDPNMTTIKIDIDQVANSITIYNDGRGIPIVIHKEENIYVPTLIFGHLLTSSNFDDTEKKVTGGRNGFGAKLCNIFSHKFTLETASREQKKRFTQIWEKNMGSSADPQIVDYKGSDYTRVSFFPDLRRFNMNNLDNDFVSLLKRRAYDLAGTTPGVKVYLNGELLTINSFEKYAALYNRCDTNQQEETPSLYSHVNDRWEVLVLPSDGSFQHVSFVNSIATTKGGAHVNHVCNKIITRLIEDAQKKIKGKDNQLRPQQVRQHIWLFINCKIENPCFDSQTKENMTLQEKEFGSSCTFSEKFLKKVSDLVTETIVSWYNLKVQNELNKKGSSVKRSKLRGMAKLDDANDAGTSKSRECTLILTEGDSAKSLAVAGVAVVGRDKYGVFPLKGKVLNIRETAMSNVLKNKEIESLVKIIGLDFKKKYDDDSTISTLRYGKIMFMTDQDYDGSHIKGLLINFFHYLWPNLVKHNFLEQFITPIVKVRKNDKVKAFYSIPEYEEWKTATPDFKTWQIKYYKGLGTSTSVEAREYFEDLVRHRIKFKYSGSPCDDAIVLAFSKSKADSRKRWLDNYQAEQSRRQEFGLPQVYLYQKDTVFVTYSDFVNKELVLFSHADNIRSIPSVIDGLKPGQRKVIYSCFRKNITKEIKVFQLAGVISSEAAYHHGEQSLVSTIINLAQDFVGTNNINLLLPEGQFGTRIKGGKDASAARYISTALNSITRCIFLKEDDTLLNYLYEDNQMIEPEWYCPIIPMILVNGADGIGTGYATKVPNYNPREIIENLKRLIRKDDPLPMLPWFKSFTGEILEVSPERSVVSGRAYHAGKDTMVITELPIRVWTQSYKESVLEPLMKGSENSDSYALVDYKDYTDESTINYLLKFRPDYLENKDDAFICNLLKLQTTILTNQMVLFDPSGTLHRYASALDILKEFYCIRLQKYIHRKEYMESFLYAEFLKLSIQERFIQEKISNKIVIENKKKKEMMEILVKNDYPSDPVKAFYKKEAARKPILEQQLQKQDTEEGTDEDLDYDYLLGMPLWSLTYERQQKLKETRMKKEEELNALKKLTPEMLWLNDLEKLLQNLDKMDEADIKKSIKSRKKTNTKKIKTPVRTRQVNCTKYVEGKKPTSSNKHLENGSEIGQDGEDIGEVNGDAVCKNLFTEKSKENGQAEPKKKAIRKAPTKKEPLAKPTTSDFDIKPKKRTLGPKSVGDKKEKKPKKVQSSEKASIEIEASLPPPRKLEGRKSKAQPKKYVVDSDVETEQDSEKSDVFVISDDN
ncbi:hypothetical protein HZS_788 [Henneguya salminicola]|nr:hypothetical protein HZS_788 [Henneguya salminicola]